MPTLTSYRPTQNLSISSSVSGANLKSGAGAIEGAIAGAAQSAFDVGAEWIRKETEQQAKQYAFERDNEYSQFSENTYTEALNNYDPATDSVVFTREDGTKNDTRMNVHQYFISQSEKFYSRTPEPPTDLAKNTWDAGYRSTMSKMLDRATTDRITQRSAYEQDKYETKTEGESKWLQANGSTITHKNVSDSVKKIKEAGEVYSMAFPFDKERRNKKAAESSVAAMGVDSLIDNNKLSDAITALKYSDVNSDNARAKTLNRALSLAVKEFLGDDATFTGTTQEGGVTILHSSKGTVEISDRGAVGKPMEAPMSGEVNLPPISISGEVTLDSTVYDALSDDAYAGLVDRLLGAMKSSKVDTSKRAIMEQKNLVASAMDPNAPTRKTPNFKDSLNPVTMAFLKNIDDISYSDLKPEEKEQAIAELIAAGVGSNVMNKTTFASPAEVTNMINNVDSQVDKTIQSLGVAVSPNLTNLSKIKVREVLGSMEAERAKKLNDPAYYLQNSSGLRNSFSEGLKKGDLTKYFQKMGSLKRSTGTSEYTPLFPKSYLEESANQINELVKSGSSGVIEVQKLIKNYKTMAGENFPRFFAEMEEEKIGLDPSMKFVAKTPSTIEGDRASYQMISNIANRKAIEDVYKTVKDTDSTIDPDLKSRVSELTQDVANYMYRVNGFAMGANEVKDLQETVLLEAKRLIPLGTKANKAAEEAYFKFVSSLYYPAGNRSLVDKSILESNKMTKGQADDLAKKFSNGQNLIPLIDVDTMASQKVKDDAKGAGFTNVSNYLADTFKSDVFGEPTPVFLPQGIAIRFEPKNGAPSFYLLDKKAKNKWLVIPYKDAVDYNPEKAIQEMKNPPSPLRR